MDQGGHMYCSQCCKNGTFYALFKRCISESSETFPIDPFMINLKIDVTVLHCSICLQPFKAPCIQVQCKGGHMVCGHCIGELPGNGCQKYVDRVGGFEHEQAMDVVVSAAMIECSHDGCLSMVAYHELHDHKIACPYSPCACTELGCGFTASPPILIAHIRRAHSVPVQRFWYGKPSWYMLPVPVPGLPRHMVIGYGDDATVFALILGVLGPDVVVSSVCIRSAVCLRPWYTGKLWATGQPVPAVTTMADSSMDTVKAVIEPTSCATPDTVAFEELTSFLTVSPRYLSVAGPFKEVAFWFCIDKKN